MTTRSRIRGTETSMASVRERFGGVDTPSAVAGMFTAFGVLVFIGSLIAAGAGGLDFQLNAIDLEGNAVELVTSGIVLAVLAVLAAFFVGGWAAGRMARYDGGINGLASAMWALLLIAVFAALGAWVGAEYNAFQQAGLPDWFSQMRGDDVTTLGIVSAIVAIAAMFVGGYLGGKVGEMYHRKADAALADSQVGHQSTTVGETEAIDHPIDDR